MRFVKQTAPRPGDAAVPARLRPHHCPGGGFAPDHAPGNNAAAGHTPYEKKRIFTDGKRKSPRSRHVFCPARQPLPHSALTHTCAQAASKHRFWRQRQDTRMGAGRDARPSGRRECYGWRQQRAAVRAGAWGSGRTRTARLRGNSPTVGIWPRPRQTVPAAHRGTGPAWRRPWPGFPTGRACSSGVRKS